MTLLNLSLICDTNWVLAPWHFCVFFILQCELCEELLSQLHIPWKQLHKSQLCVCENRQMCPNLANYTAQQLLFPRNCMSIDFSPFVESESGDGLSAYVTVHITHSVQKYRDKLVSHIDILHLVSDIAYTPKWLRVFMGTSHVCSSEMPSPHSLTHQSATRATPQNVSAPVVSRLSQSVSSLL